jgi:hypothetical protein
MTEDHTSDAAADESAEAQPEEAPLNRAERRARGKKSTPQQSPGKNAFVPKGSASQGQRLWANRRSG